MSYGVYTNVPLLAKNRYYTKPKYTHSHTSEKKEKRAELTESTEQKRCTLPSRLNEPSPTNTTTPKNKTSSVGDRPAARGETTPPDERKK